MPTYILPIIHPNGTSRDDLDTQLEDWHFAIGAAIKAGFRATPNSRDYYPVPGLLPKALEQHERRQNTLRALLAEIEEQCMEMNE